jgi:hypothetical protein
MMKLKRFIFMTIVILMITAIYAYSQEEVLTVDNSVFDHPQRSAAVFDHDDHNEKAMLEDDCSVCHHVYEGKELIEDESSEESLCSECHSIKKTPENVIPLRMAFHNRCKECHFESNKGPVLCGECHIK